MGCQIWFSLCYALLEMYWRIHSLMQQTHDQHTTVPGHVKYDCQPEIHNYIFVDSIEISGRFRREAIGDHSPQVGPRLPP